MTWTVVQTISVLASQWVYTAPVSGSYFRLKHTWSGLPDYYFKAKLGQLQVLPDNSKEIYDIQNIAAKAEAEIFHLKTFPELTNRRIGIRGPTGDIPPVAWSWQIQIEVSDFLEVEGGGGNGSGLEPWQLKSADYTAKTGDRLWVDTSVASWVLTLPLSPSPQDTLELLAINDLSVKPLEINFNGSKFQGLDENLLLNKLYGSLALIYVDSNLGWLARPQGQLVRKEDPHFSNVTLLLHMDGANGSNLFTDVMGKPITAAGGATISTAQSKFGGGSGHFNGVLGTGLSTPANAAWELATVSFTIEFWVYVPTESAGGCIAACGSINAGYGWAFYVNPTTVTFASIGSYQEWIRSGLSLANGWHHVSISKLASETQAYIGIDGQVAPIERKISNSGTWFNANESLYIGRINRSDQYHSTFNGYIDELRITTGVARYTSNFNVPTAAF